MRRARRRAGAAPAAQLAHALPSPNGLSERVRKAVRWTCLRLVWNVPIRPKHVPLPIVAGAVHRLVWRAILIGAIVGVAGSIPWATAAAHRLAAIGAAVRPPVLGAYTIGDILPLLLAAPNQIAVVWRVSEPAFIAAALCFVAGVALGLYLCWGSLYRVPWQYRGTEEDREWGSLADAHKARLIGHNEPGIVCGSLEVPKLFGVIRQAPEILVYPGPQHVELSASSGSGKDVLLACTDGYWPYSMITSDAKVEQYQLGGGRAHFRDGKDVFLFNPGAPGRGEEYVDLHGRKHVELFGSNSWNPLDEIAWGTPNEAIELRTISAKIVARSAKDFEGENGHWTRLAQSMYMVGAYKVMYDPEEVKKGPTRVAQLIALGDGIPGQTKLSRPSEGGDTLTHETLESLIGFSVDSGQFGSMPSWARRVEAEMTTRMQIAIEKKKGEVGATVSERDFEQFARAQRRETQEQVARFRETLRHPDLEVLLGQLLKIRGDEAGSAYSAFNQCMGPWLSETIERNTMTSDFGVLTALNGERPCHIYLGNQMSTRDAVLRIHQIFLSILLTKALPNMAMDHATKRIKSPWKWPCILRLNELDALGEVPGLVEAVPMLRSYNIIYFGAYQTRAQLEKTYGEAERKIVTNQCDVQIVHTPGDDKEASELSDALGKRMTVKAQDSTSGQGKSQSRSSGSVPIMDAGQVKEIPKMPAFRDVTVRGKKFLVTSRPAYQIIRGPGLTRPLYSRKEQWFNEHFRWLADEYRAYGLAPIMRSEATLTDLRRRNALHEGETALEQERQQPQAAARDTETPTVALKPIAFEGRNTRVTRRARRLVAVQDGIRVRNS